MSPSLPISIWALSPEWWEREASEHTRGLQTRHQELNGVESGRELLPGPGSLQQAVPVVSGRGPPGWTHAESHWNWAGGASVQEKTSTDEMHKVGHSSHWPLTNTSLGPVTGQPMRKAHPGLGEKAEGTCNVAHLRGRRTPACWHCAITAGSAWSSCLCW